MGLDGHWKNRHGHGRLHAFLRVGYRFALQDEVDYAFIMGVPWRVQLQTHQKPTRYRPKAIQEIEFVESKSRLTSDMNTTYFLLTSFLHAIASGSFWVSGSNEARGSMVNTAQAPTGGRI
jgi:hypothetical protein